MDLGVPRIYSEAEVELGVKGNQLITSLDAYPFCFIRSNRIKAYLGSHNFINEDKDPTLQSEYVNDMEGNELMMFGVQKITLSVDSRASNLLILELDLLYCNHKSLTTAIDISEGVLLAEPPSKLTSYKQALKGSQFDKGDNTMRADSTEMPGYTALMQKLSEGNIAKAELLLRETSAVAAWDNMSSKVGYTQASIKIPKFINMFELGASLKAEVNPKSRKLSENDFNYGIDRLPDVPEEDMRIINLPSKFNQPTFHINPEGKYTSDDDVDPELAAESATYTLTPHAVVWLHDPFLYDTEVNTIQSIVVTKERAFASHFIGSYQHPIVQYMGRYPANLEINSMYQGSNYDKDTDLPYLFKLMLGAIDSNAVHYPQGNTYNYLKIRTYPTALLGVEHFIPKQSHIQARSDNSDIEVFTCVFIENSMDKMLEAAKVKVGKRVINPESVAASGSIIADYLINIGKQVKAGKTYSGAEQRFHENMIRQLAQIVLTIEGKAIDDTVETIDTKPKDYTRVNPNSVTTPNPFNTEGTESAGGEATDTTGSTELTEENRKDLLTSNEKGNGLGAKNYNKFVLENYRGREYFPGLTNVKFRKVTPVSEDSLIGLGERYAVKGTKINIEMSNPLVSMIETYNKQVKSGPKMKVVSGYRSVSRQKALWDKKKYAKNARAGSVSVSPPGYSEHHTGYAVDFNSVSPADWEGSLSPMYQWLRKNAWTFGFFQTYNSISTAKGGEAEGVLVEKWHWAWRGSAKSVQSLGLVK